MQEDQVSVYWISLSSIYVYLDRLFIQTDAFSCPYSVHNRCLKKYCICFSAGIKCDKDKCRCTDCGNGGDDSDNEENTATNSNIDPTQGIKETQDETMEPFADLIELKCVDSEPPLMIEDPPLLDVVTLIAI